jgi:hypothetical protein
VKNVVARGRIELPHFVVMSNAPSHLAPERDFLHHLIRQHVAYPAGWRRKLLPVVPHDAFVMWNNRVKISERLGWLPTVRNPDVELSMSSLHHMLGATLPVSG